MTKVIDLTPGNIVDVESIGSATFVAKCEHPLWNHLALVIWKLDDGTWSHDALDWFQDVGQVREWVEPEDRFDNLRKAFNVR